MANVVPVGATAVHINVTVVEHDRHELPRSDRRQRHHDRDVVC